MTRYPSVRFKDDMNPCEKDEPKVKVATREQTLDVNLIAGLGLIVILVVVLLGRSAGGM